MSAPDLNHMFAYDFPIGGPAVKREDHVQSLDTSNGGFEWVHIHGEPDFIHERLGQLNLDALKQDALSAEETRPRCTPLDAGAIIILRGVNLNKGAEPEDMISLRIWMEGSRVISCGIRPLKAIDDIIGMINGKRAPASSGDLVAKLALRLADRTDPVIADLNERVDLIEESLSDGESAAPRKMIADVRRMAIIIRRYMFPQRDALTTLEVEEFPWMTPHSMAQVKEAVERVTRLCEELDSIRDRAQIVHDQVMDMRAENTNRQMLVLTVVAAFFLPIGFLTGLLGVNVGGLPLMENPYGFSITCGVIVGILAAEYFIFKKLKLF